MSNGTSNGSSSRMRPRTRHHRHGFLPPYLLESLATSGAIDRAVVERTLRLDAELRSRRSTTEARPGGVDPGAAGQSRWVVHTASNGTDLPGDPVRREGEDPVDDAAVDEAATGITATMDLFSEVYGRDSYDDRGTEVSLTVHYGQDYANAFWDGRQLVFGDGDGQIFARFTAALDVLGHEFVHGVVEWTAGLVYQGQSGALNESVSDAFAACVKQRVAGEDAGAADWLIGEGLFLPGVSARALRDMAAPGTAYDDPRLGADPQPSHMRDFVETIEDNGGVHINSGIPNRAFALAAQAIGGSSAEGAGRIWYSALTSPQVRPNADFVTFASATVDAAGSFADQVRSAWAEVGIDVSPAPSRAWSLDDEPSRATPVPVPGADDPVTEPETGPDLEPGAPAPPADGVVRVVRSGGFAGRRHEGTVDLGLQDPKANEAAELCAAVQRSSIAPTRPGPVDGFVYTFTLPDGSQLSVPERQLTPEQARLASVVLEDEAPGGAPLA